MRQYFQYLIMAFLILLIQGCGLSDRGHRDLDVYVVKEKCKLDTNSFKKFMDEDISSEINCLEINFNQFLSGVITNNPQGIEQDDITKFIRKYFSDDVEATIKSLDVLYQLNSILLKDSRTRISRPNINKIFQILKLANSHLVKINHLFKNIDKTNAVIYREQLKSTINIFSHKVQLIIGNNNNSNHVQINLDKLLKQMLNNFSQNDFSELIFKGAPILKSSILGGNSNLINYSDALQLIKKLPKLVMIIFDSLFLKTEYFKNNEDHLYRIQLKSARMLPSILAPVSTDKKILFTHKEIIDLAQEFISIEINNNSLDIELLDKILTTLKPLTIGGISENYTFLEINKIFDHIIDFLEIRLFNNRTWDHYEKMLLQNKHIAQITQLSNNYYPELSSTRIKYLHSTFNLIIKQYRFFKKDGGLQYYIHDYARNKKSIMEIAYFRRILNIVGMKYSTKKDSLLLSMKTLEDFLLDFKPLLEEFDLWSTYPATFARNTVLLGDLFQYQSDGNLHIDADEATEYLILVMNAVEVKNQVTIKMMNLCDYGANPERPEFHVSCFRKELTNILFKQLKYQEYMPMLYQYWKEKGKKVFAKYLFSIEYFARDIPDDNIPIGSRDMTLIIGALLNIESTFIRFDSDRSNVIEHDELYPTAYKVYKQAIIDLVHQQAPDMDVSGYEKSIFLYLVKKMKIPTKYRLGAFHYLPFKRKRQQFDSFRANIGSILYNLIKVGEPNNN